MRCFIPIHTSKITSRSLASSDSSGNSNSILVYNKSGPKKTLPGSNCPFWLKPLSFKGEFLPPRDCGNAITYVAQSQGTDFVDHPRWITIDFYCDPVGVRGEFQPLGTCQKGDPGPLATEGKRTAKHCSTL